MYCKNCGCPLPEGSIYCNNCGVHINNGSNFCPSCGTQCGPGYQNCPNCGAPMNGPAAPGGNPPPPGSGYNPGYNGYYGAPHPPRSKLAAGLLGIFLGSLGIHNFYLGYTSKAVCQLLLSVLGGIVTCGITTVAVEIWAFVEAIMIFTGSISCDADGVPLKD